MTLSATKALAVFSSMGLGMAAPYVLFSAFPSLIKFLPKPGNWMIVFKQLMGFVMMATVVWLIWVFGAQTDHLAVFILLAALLIISLGAWIFGKWSVPTRRRSTRWTAMIMAGVLFFTAGWGVVHVTKRTPQLPVAEMQTNSNEWIPYSPEKVAALRQEGKAVFVDFTAKWCLICQANKVVLHSSDLTKAFHEKGVVTMTADWTKRDGVITEALQTLGRSGVPVYVLYPSDISKAPYILPQTLTSTVVQDYLGKLNTTTVYAD